MKSINTFCLRNSKTPQFAIVSKDAVDIVLIFMLSLRRSLLKMFFRSLVALIVSDFVSRFQFQCTIYCLIIYSFPFIITVFLDMLYSSVLSAFMCRLFDRSFGVFPFDLLRQLFRSCSPGHVICIFRSDVERIKLQLCILMIS